MIESDFLRYFLILFLIIVFSVFELLFPAEKNHTITGKIRNIFFISIYLLLGLLVTITLYGLIQQWIPGRPTVQTLPSALLLIAYLFVMDFIFYWYHRAEHAYAPLWAVHELHHADSDLNVTSSMRTYFLEYPLQFFIIAIPTTYLITIDSSLLLPLLVITTTWLFFTHTNVRLHLGFLSKYICGPQVHRIHHSNQKIHEDKNFAQFFPIIDVVFGTYYEPHKNEFPTTGTPNLPSHASIPTVLLRPWKLWFGKKN